MIAAAGGAGTVPDVTTPATPSTPPKGNLAAGVDALLAGFGVERTATRDKVREIVEEELRRRNHVAEVFELRYGVLSLSAAPAAAQFLRYDRDNLLTALEEQIPGVVVDVRVRVERTRR